MVNVKKQDFERKKRTLLLLNMATGKSDLHSILGIVKKNSWDNDISKELERYEFIAKKKRKYLPVKYSQLKGKHIATYPILWQNIISYCFELVVNEGQEEASKIFTNVMTAEKINVMYKKVDGIEKQVNRTVNAIGKQKDKSTIKGIANRTNYKENLNKLIISELLYPNYFDTKEKVSLSNFKSGSKVETDFIENKLARITEALLSSNEFMTEIQKILGDYFKILLRNNLVSEKSSFNEIIRAFFIGVGDKFTSAEYVKYKYPLPKTNNKALDKYRQDIHLLTCQTFHDFVYLCEIYAAIKKLDETYDFQQPFAQMAFELFKQANKTIANPYVMEKIPLETKW